MRSRLLIIASLFAILGFVSTANAQSGDGFKVGPQIGIADFESFYFGGNIVLPLGIQLGESTLDLNANFNYVLEDHVTWFLIDGNLHYPIPVEGGFNPYVGAGIVISIFSYDSPDFGDFNFDDLFSKTVLVADQLATQATDTDFGLNLKGGFEYSSGGKMIPFGEAGFYLKDGGFLYLQGGLRFLLGGG